MIASRVGHWSGLVGGHDPQLADGGVAWPSDHVGDSVGDVLGPEDLGLLIEGVDDLAADLVVVVRAELGVHATRLDDADAHVALGDLLAQRLGEAVDAELGEVVDAVPVPGDAPGIELMLTMSATRRGPSSAALSRCGSAAWVV